MAEAERILKGYDSALMRRILSYVRPYRLIAVAAVLAVLVATAGEMTVPVLLKIAVDGHILPTKTRIDVSLVGDDLKDRLPEGRQIGRYVFLTSDDLADLTRSEKRRLTDEGVLSRDNYFVLSLKPSTETVVAAHSDLFTVQSGLAAIRTGDFKSLSPEEILRLRADDLRGVLKTAALLVAVLVTVLACSFAGLLAMAYVGQRVLKDLRTELYDHTIRLSMGFLNRNPVGRLVTRITNDVETINELFSNVITSFLKDISLMIGVYITLFLLSPRLALVTVFTLPPLFLAAVWYRVKAREAFRWVRTAVSTINSFLSEHLSGIGIVQLFAREQKTLEEFQEKNTDLRNANFRQMRVSATFRPLVDVLATVSVGVIVYFGARFFLGRLVSLGVVIAFTNLIGRFFDPVRDLSEKYNILQSAMAGTERVFSLLDESETTPQPDDPVEKPGGPGAVEFERVSFYYKEGEPVLRDLSFRVEPGETVAIVGYTGAGKTTITSLLTRLYEIQGGRILLDGQDIRTLRTDDLRSRVQSVLQDVFVFTGTIEDNIKLGSPIDSAMVREAAALVRADRFIEELPNGYETEMAERGANLSTGQRQLLSFARVIAHNPDVLLLDEATANIDGETERLIQEALGTLLSDRTSLVIAHRLSTIKNADRILVLDHGRLVEEGTHLDLLALGGLYNSLYRMQYSRQSGE